MYDRLKSLYATLHAWLFSDGKVAVALRYAVISIVTALLSEITVRLQVVDLGNYSFALGVWGFVVLSVKKWLEALGPTKPPAPSAATTGRDDSPS